MQDWLEANGCTHQLMYVRGGAQPVTHPDGEPGAYTQKYGITHTLDQVMPIAARCLFAPSHARVHTCMLARLHAVDRAFSSCVLFPLTLDQLFEAPDLIKTALCNSNGINTVYVGNK